MPAGSRATITPVATMPPAAIPPTVAAPPAPPPGGTVGWPDGHSSGGWQFIGSVGPGLGWQRRAMRCGDHGLPHARDPFGENLAAAEIELRKHVVEQQERRRRQKLRLGEQQ